MSRPSSGALDGPAARRPAARDEVVDHHRTAFSKADDEGVDLGPGAALGHGHEQPVVAAVGVARIEGDAGEESLVGQALDRHLGVDREAQGELAERPGRVARGSTPGTASRPSRQ